MDYFTIEEINLLCIYSTESRAALLADLHQALPDIYDPDMKEIFTTAIAKLESMSDADFEDAAHDIVFTDEDTV